MFKRLLFFLFIFVLIVGSLRMVASFYIGGFLKQSAEKVKRLDIKVERVEAHPDIGRFVFHNITVFDDKFDDRTQARLEVERFMVNFEWWESAAYGKLTLEMRMEKPKLFITTKLENKEIVMRRLVFKLYAWGKLFKRKGFRLDIPSIVIKDGEIIYEDFRTEPPVKLSMSKINGKITDAGFRSRRKRKSYYTRFAFRGQFEETAKFKTSGGIFFKRDDTKQDGFIKISFTDIPLEKLSPIALRYDNLEFDQGKLDLIADLKFGFDFIKGSVSSRFKNMRVKRFGEQTDPVFATSNFISRAELVNVKLLTHEDKTFKGFVVKINEEFKLKKSGVHYWGEVAQRFKRSLGRGFLLSLN